MEELLDLPTQVYLLWVRGISRYSHQGRLVWKSYHEKGRVGVVIGTQHSNSCTHRRTDVLHPRYVRSFVDGETGGGVHVDDPCLMWKGLRPLRARGLLVKGAGVIGREYPYPYRPTPNHRSLVSTESENGAEDKGERKETPERKDSLRMSRKSYSENARSRRKLGRES